MVKTEGRPYFVRGTDMTFFRFSVFFPLKSCIFLNIWTIDSF